MRTHFKTLFFLVPAALIIACSQQQAAQLPVIPASPGEEPSASADVPAVPERPMLRLEPGSTVVPDTRAAHRAMFHERNAPAQQFACKGSDGAALTGKHGTTIQVEPNSFVDADGKPYTGKVRITLREALDPYTIVNCGLFTTYKDQPLQSGGMIEVLAFAGEKPLRIAENRSLHVGVPSENKLPDMNLFAGRKSAKGIDWVDPMPIREVEIPQVVQVAIEEPEMVADAKVNVPDVSWTVKYYKPEKTPGFIDKMMCRRFADSTDLRFPPDSAIILNGWNIQLHRGNERCRKVMQDFLVERARLWPPMPGPAQGQLAREGTNTFLTDPNSTYLFQMKNLGWANIDRLLNCPNTQAVDLITQVGNAKDFDVVYISMIVPEHRMFLPGYKKGDGSYGFSHGDFEQMQLPVGDKAILIATAYKGGKPWFAQHAINIKTAQRVQLLLEETTSQKLREDLMATL